MGTERNLIRELKLRCGVPRAFAELELSEMDSGGEEDYREVLREFQRIALKRLDSGEFLENPVLLYVSGPFGTGKTRILTGLLKRAYQYLVSHRPGLISPRTSPLFLRSQDLVELRFRRFEGEEEETELLRERVRSSVLLAIDDVGRLNDFRGEMNYLERVVEDRVEEGLSVLISSNLGDSELKKNAPRFLDFLSFFETYTLTCASWRGK
jgi:DNA replication protein DnaC